jgi:hypothetical protein
MNGRQVARINGLVSSLFGEFDIFGPKSDVVTLLTRIVPIGSEYHL